MRLPSSVQPKRTPPIAPCWSTQCDVCGAQVSLEVRRGRVVSYCAGCVRNAERRALGLPELSWFRLPAPEPIRRRPTRPRAFAAHRSPAWDAMLNALPRRPEAALSMRALAARCGIKRSFALHILRVLAADGRAARHLGPSPTQPGRAVPLWWRGVNAQLKKAA